MNGGGGLSVFDVSTGVQEELVDNSFFVSGRLCSCLY